MYLLLKFYPGHTFKNNIIYDDKSNSYLIYLKIYKCINKLKINYNLIDLLSSNIIVHMYSHRLFAYMNRFKNKEMHKELKRIQGS